MNSIPLNPTCNDSVLLCTKLLSIDLNNYVQASTWPFYNVKILILVSIPLTSSKILRNSLSSSKEYKSKALFLIRPYILIDILHIIYQ